MLFRSQGGLTGALFVEFAFTLVGAVTISAIDALTLTPMLGSKILVPHHRLGRFDRKVVDAIDVVMTRVTAGYRGMLSGTLDNLPVVAVFAVLVLTSIGFLYVGSKSELAPEEDQGFLLGIASSTSNATLQQRQLYSKPIVDALLGRPETETIFEIDLINQTLLGHVLKPWDKRKDGSSVIQARDQALYDGNAGLKIVSFNPPSLPGANGLPIQIGRAHV